MNRNIPHAALAHSVLRDRAHDGLEFQVSNLVYPSEEILNLAMAFELPRNLSAIGHAYRARLRTCKVCSVRKLQRQARRKWAWHDISILYFETLLCRSEAHTGFARGRYTALSQCQIHNRSCCKA
jgi:hypothetical protein